MHLAEANTEPSPVREKQQFLWFAAGRPASICRVDRIMQKFDSGSATRRRNHAAPVGFATVT